MNSMKRVWLCRYVLALLLLVIGTMSAWAGSWTNKASIPIPVDRAASTAFNNRMYILGGSSASGPTDAVQVYDPATNGWTRLSGILTPLFGTKAVADTDPASSRYGTIYMPGGFGVSGATNAVIAYSTTLQTSTVAGYLNQARGRMGAAFLNGKVYVAGGADFYGNIWDTIEEFNPETGSSEIIATLPEKRHAVPIVAANGKLYIFGGNNGSVVTNTGWEFDPIQRTFTDLPLMPASVECLSAGVNNGKIYLVGNTFGATTGNPVYAYDYQARTWEVVTSVPTVRDVPQQEIINGTLYVAGGASYSPETGYATLGTNEAFALTNSNGWVTKAPMPTPVSRAASGVINGRIFVLGGIGATSRDTVQIYSTLDDTWVTGLPLSLGVMAPAAATLGETIYLAGGDPGNEPWNTGMVQSYNPTNGQSRQIGSLQTPRFRMNGAILGNKMYVAGGIGSTGLLDSIEEFDLTTNISTVKATMPQPLTLAGVVAVGTKIYLIGGGGNSGLTNDCWEYDPAYNTFMAKSPMLIAGEARNIVEHNGKIYVVGSSNGPAGFSGVIQEYDIATDSWRVVEYLPTPRYAMATEVVNGTLYAIGGDNNTGPALGVNEAWGIGTSPPPLVDITPPTTTAMFSGIVGNNGWYTSDVQMTLSATDDPAGSGLDRSEYNIPTEFGYWRVYNGPYTISAERVTTGSYRSADKQANIETSHEFVVAIDKTAPVTTASLSGTVGNNGWYTTPVTVTLAATDSASGVARTEWSTNSSSWNSYSVPITLGIGTNGITQLYYRSVDVAGNTEWTRSISVSIDRTAPITSATPTGTAGINGWYVSPVTAALSAIDSASGVALTEYSLDNGASWAVYAVPLTIATEGTKTVLYRATNNAGLVSTVKSLTVKIDTSAPQLLPFVERISVNSSGVEGNGPSYSLLLNQDGRYAAFWSVASNLVPGDTNNEVDVFVHDRSTGNTERVSVSTTGEQAIYPLNVPHFTGSYLSSISADGRYVLFSANADNLAPPLGTLGMKVFLRDRQAGTTEMVSVSQTGLADNSDSYGGSISADGRYVAFSSSATNIMPGITAYQPRVFVKDRQTGAIENISVSSDGVDGAGNNMLSNGASISNDGRYVLFLSSAANLVPNDTNGSQDLFIRDRQLNQTTRVNVSSTGEQSASSTIPSFSMSADGRYIAFESTAKNLVTGYFLNNYTNTYVHDMQTGSTVLVNVSSTGAVNGGWQHSLNSISPDGRYVAYMTDMVNIIPESPFLFYPIIIHDMQTGANKVLCSDSCSSGSLAAGGAVAGFSSTKTDLVQGDTNAFKDIFVLDQNPARLNGTMSNNGWYTSDVQVDLATATDTVSGASRREYSINGSGWSTFTTPFTLNTEGATTLTVRPVDLAGIAGTTTTLTLKIDKTPPTTIASAGKQPDGASVVTLTASDATSQVTGSLYRINDGAWTTYTVPVAITTAGVSVVEYYSTNSAGLVETVKQISVTIDYTAPVLSGLTNQILEATSQNGARAAFTVTATDNIDQAVNVICSPASGSIFAIRDTVVNCTATDTHDNQANGNFIITVRDTTKPTISGIPTTSPNASDWYNSTVTVHFSATDSGSGVRSLTPDTALTSDGVNQSATGTATDNSGNSVSYTVGGINIDKTPAITASPVLAGTLGDNGIYISNVQVTLAASDNLSGVKLIEYRLNGGAWLTYSTPFTINATATVEYNSIDTAGNPETIKTLPIKIDKVAPALDTVDPSNGATGVTISKTITINFNENIYPAENFTGIVLKKGKTVIPITRNYIGKTVTIDPSSDLANNTTYTLTIPDRAVKDSAGFPQSGASNYTFTTIKR